MLPKLTLHMLYKRTAKAFMAGGLPRGGVSVKLQPQDLQR